MDRIHVITHNLMVNLAALLQGSSAVRAPAIERLELIYEFVAVTDYFERLAQVTRA